MSQSSRAGHSHSATNSSDAKKVVSLLNSLFHPPNYKSLQPLAQNGWIPMHKVRAYCNHLPPAATIRKALDTVRSDIVEIHHTTLALRRRSARSRVRFYVEQLFSTAHWDKDLNLQQVAAANGGYVPLSTLCNFPGLSKILEEERPGMATDPSAREAFVAEALKSSREVESSPHPPVGARRKPLETRVREQVEHYFLHDQLFQDPSFIPIESVLRQPAMRELVWSTQVVPVAKALAGSAVVEVGLDRRHVRKRNGAEAGPGDSAPGTASATTPDPAFMPPAPRWRARGPAPPGPADFTVVQFNVLSQWTMRHQRYPYVAPAHYTWRHRLFLLSEGLRRCRPDVVCLQEVQSLPDAQVWSGALPPSLPPPLAPTRPGSLARTPPARGPQPAATAGPSAVAPAGARTRSDPAVLQPVGQHPARGNPPPPHRPVARRARLHLARPGGARSACSAQCGTVRRHRPGHPGARRVAAWACCCCHKWRAWHTAFERVILDDAKQLSNLPRRPPFGTAWCAWLSAGCSCSTAPPAACGPRFPPFL